MELKQVLPKIKMWRQNNQRIVLVTGVFDILHVEHIRFLTKAKAAGDKLIVGIETDARVKKIKGEHRPANNQEIRLEQLAGVKPVDAAFILPDKFDTQADWENCIATIKPAIYAVSSHTSYLENKRDIAEKFGAKLDIVHEFNPDISTTHLFEKIKAEI
jgi:rfaE bifunctional protein nucleotidyltransferase chain/domain